MSVEETRAERVSRRQPANDLNQRGRGVEGPRVRQPTTTKTGAVGGPGSPPAQGGGPGGGPSPVTDAEQPAFFGVPVGPGWPLAPLRLFLGVTFVYAGIQKLTDPQFFNPKATGYIGKQIQSFAHGSPISGLLLHVALPHASFFGGLIAYGEIAIGLGALVGLLARPAAFFGMLLSLMFFLSASWRVYPYFYGADIVFTFAWLAMLLAPHAGLPNLDEEAARQVAARWRWSEGARRTVMALAFAVPVGDGEGVLAPGALPTGRVGRVGAAGRSGVRHNGRWAQRQQQAQSRRNFLLGVASGVVGVLGVTWLWGAFRPAAPTTPVDNGGTGGSTPGTGSTSGSTVIAKSSDVPVNSAATFTIPSNGDPGVVVHLSNGQFVAFDATCTHAGCPVQYDPTSKDLLCPCHGAVFDPANQAAVLQGPASTPLTAVPVTVRSNGDIVLS
jgi:thiosulfate dehydrogenase (quinone) large subunit